MSLGSRWEFVEIALREHFYGPDLQAARAVYAAVAAHRFMGQPVWIMLVAPPGSAKTSTVDGLRDHSEVHLVDTVTPNTFLSGQILPKGKQPHSSPSLLHRIGESGILVIPDFSTILGTQKEARARILADLRRIFDGYLRKETGTSDEVPEWSGRITTIVCATPDIDRHYGIFASLGERFLMVRCGRPGGDDDGEAAGLVAMSQDPEQVRADLRDAVHMLFDGLPYEEPTLSESIQKRIAAIGEFVVRARTGVPRDSRGKQIIYIPEAEANTRLSQQLCQLARGNALLDERATVTDEDLPIVQRVALNCIPASRWKVLDAAIHGTKPDLPESTLSYNREDLKILGLLDQNGQLSKKAAGWLDRSGYFLLHEIPPPNELKKKRKIQTVVEGPESRETQPSILTGGGIS